MVRAGLCLYCGVSTLEGEFCSLKHEERYKALEYDKKKPGLNPNEKARRRKLLDMLFEATTKKEYRFAVEELRKYHLTKVGRGDRVINLRAPFEREYEAA